MRVVEVNMEWHRNEGAGKTGESRENPPTKGIGHDSHLRKSGRGLNPVRLGARTGLEFSAKPVPPRELWRGHSPRKHKRLRGEQAAAFTPEKLASLTAQLFHRERSKDAAQRPADVITRQSLPSPPFRAGLIRGLAATAILHLGGGKREILGKTRRPAASSGMIPICENPGATEPGIKPRSLWWEACNLTTTPPRPINFMMAGTD
ncbi:hypothetical protein PR048_013449 [Dryococelus australis]|uniref:Uncharacterized protein n=1 Tax=Dryococelus australis TaxID=614101 RepID=A0ABQ9HS79_9NEOP|nr:hypothetical protein PR048_013449 [Dryococelus australis]